ncbi:MAG: DNA recombination protein RmuC, partial [Candidatus Omnitrophica bacterium]|nr:DNA recombination protein RmuC [Candidatus Omnitrophota bacterium]
MAWLAGSLFLLFSLIIIGILLKIFSLLNERLSQMNQSLQEENRAVRERIGDATNIFGNVQASLGKLEKTNQQIVEISKDISSLQELLRAPKFRGQMGETLLENLLSQVLPKAYYQMQYRFKSGEAVDAALKLGERLVPIDAKFSLENFQKMLQAPDEQLKNTHRRKFIQDIKARVDEVASKYI